MLKRVAITIFMVLAFVIANHFVIERFSSPSNQLDGSQVIVYGAAWCTTCKAAKHFLYQQGIPFREYDIETSEKGRADYQQLGGGGIPIIVINDQVMRGFYPQTILAWLAQ